ncbi:hypothetical protein FSP39_000500 [Pinctada imbricata]|uniref:Uncharacterized protein n=1 Tax=Pinctada imbricata TaxID=66713 RepID=A0AA88YWQ1_PINIB|nr:hypothetical protein FSP39_000500 [Pinctada imbricata]
MGAQSSKKKKKRTTTKDTFGKKKELSNKRTDVDHGEGGNNIVNMASATPWIKQDINIDNDMTGAALLDDGRLLISKNGTKSLLLMTEKGKVLSSLSLGDDTWGIKMIDCTDGAVVVQNECLQFFTVTKRGILKGNTLNVPVLFDFVFLDNFYYIGGDKKIMVYNNVLCHKRDIHVSDAVGYMTNRDDTSLCYTVWGRRNVYCLTTDGVPIFTYTHDTLRGTVGVTVDQEGYIYVCGYISKNVHQLNHEGNLQRIIFDDLPERPYCISFNRRDDLAVIGCIRKILLFDLT